MTELPVRQVIPELQRALALGRNAVLQAPPGAGKTTLVPLALLGAPWLGTGRIVMLEPRRLAARAAARRMASQLGESVGETIGYRVRRDTRVSSRTRIEVVTEGVLTRMLASDPALDGVGVVIFDEFHERSLHADLGLALTRHAQQLVRDDLRIVVMSATLDGEPVARLLGDAAVITSEGRRHPVHVTWVGRRPDQRIEPAMAAAIQRALRETEGDVLAFLPGQGEIARTLELLESAAVPAELHALYGNLTFDQQDRALAPSPNGRRKVVLSTSIAESSLTIEGVRVVVDGGLSRVPRFSPRTGMTRLETVRVSRASAEQRAGRAGRLAPGACYRLWAAGEHAHLLAHATPEILEADLAPLALELANAGVTHVADLPWLDLPPAGALARARALLRELDALDADHRVTAHGRRMASLGTHPRLAHMLVRSNDRGEAALACDLAGLLEERDVLRQDAGAHDADLRPRVELVRHARRRERVAQDVAGMRVNHDALARAAEGALAWRRELAVPRAVDWTDDDALGRIVALAYPDRVAQRRPGDASRFLMRSGAGATFRDSPALAREPWIVAVETDGRSPESAVYTAAAISLDDVLADFAGHVAARDDVRWDEGEGVVRATRRETLGAIVLRERTIARPDDALVLQAWRDALGSRGLGILDWSDAAVALRARLACVHVHMPDWPDVSDAALVQSAEAWLLPHLTTVRTRQQRAELDVGGLLLSRLDWAQRARLDVLAPTHFTAPTGSRLPIDYGDAHAPVVRVRLQEMFGVRDTPRVLDGRVPVTLHLLSPAHRPLQVTQDLAGFWRTSYFDVRKDMRGRYPRHPWPDDPLAAEPTRRVKPRGT
ncbi:MAG: ATP-dependent helicase HrpB [Gemmatimonadaceae bacterium]|nr:ATP-dependent helicase HrpB [Gemmatimonadaceae bacterium]